VSCALCDTDGGLLVVRTERFRLVRVLDEPAHPAFWRLIWNDHVAEFSDLSAADRLACMEAVVGVEQTLREQLKPAKINLASFGNVVPHLHWHVVARFEGDAHWPAPIWAAPRREAAPPVFDLAALDALLAQRLLTATR
jgi:diadenosine tetraphosphate (Ap4A) HIT family hydrolase